MEVARVMDKPVKERCTAKSKQSGERCKRWPVPGLKVCKIHGGGTPVAKQAARMRLAALVDPAIATLTKEMLKAEKSADRQRAANSILDRAGIVRKTDSAADEARAALLQRILDIRAERAAGGGDLPILDAQVVDDDA